MLEPVYCHVLSCTVAQCSPQANKSILWLGFHSWSAKLWCVCVCVSGWVGGCERASVHECVYVPVCAGVCLYVPVCVWVIRVG